METPSCRSSSPRTPLASVPPHQVDHGRLPGGDDPGLHRLEARRALAQPLERLSDGLVLDHRRRPPQLDARRSPGSNGGTTSKLAEKVRGWPSLTTRSWTSGVSSGCTLRSDRASSMAWPTRCSAASCRISPRKRCLITRAAPCPAGSRAAGRLAVAAVTRLISAVHLLGGNLDTEVLAGLADVYQFGLHLGGCSGVVLCVGWGSRPAMSEPFDWRSRPAMSEP